MFFVPNQNRAFEARGQRAELVGVASTAVQHAKFHMHRCPRVYRHLQETMIGDKRGEW